jgi:hypothetical protein
MTKCFTLLSYMRVYKHNYFISLDLVMIWFRNGFDLDSIANLIENQVDVNSSFCTDIISINN